MRMKEVVSCKAHLCIVADNVVRQITSLCDMQFLDFVHLRCLYQPAKTTMFTWKIETDAELHVFIHFQTLEILISKFQKKKSKQNSKCSQ
jgi:hypothetical protein